MATTSYKELKNEGYPDNLEIRVKYQRRFHNVEYFDGVRVTNVPEGKHVYHTRHADNGDMAHPVTIAREGKIIIVNFCGSIVSDEPINIKGEEEKLTYVSWI